MYATMTCHHLVKEKKLKLMTDKLVRYKKDQSFFNKKINEYRTDMEFNKEKTYINFRHVYHDFFNQKL